MSIATKTTALETTSAEAPRKLDPARTFENLVQWIHDKSVAERAPGLIMGVSGTDSILAFLACAEAFARMGKQHRILGVHFAPVEGDGKSWIVDEVFPWLKKQAPKALLEIDRTPDHQSDQIRWGRLFARAVSDTAQADSLSSNHYFSVGTRNATEDYLGTYSQQSGAVSMMPLVDLLKTDVLDICNWLGVPEIAIAKSCEPDCSCGRFQVAADHLREVDLWIMHRKGLLSRGYLDKAMTQDVQRAVLEYVLEEESRNRFRKKTPYRPGASLAVVTNNG